jgi:serine/threonine-protein kinase
MDPLTGGSIIASKYRLERVLARGGMGAVWLGRHLKLDVDVAIKLMKPHHTADPESRMRFEREARAAAQLKIPNVVQVYDYGMEEDTPYIVMELLDGEDLQVRLQRERRLSISATLSIIDPVCKALGRAHATGIVHRDLKPGNIFLARQEVGPELVKILDFGIAKFAGSAPAGTETQTGALLGSPSYMSPEQVRNSKQVDHRSDLWSLGVIAFECITGRRPFSGDDIGYVLVELCTAPIPIASEIVPGLAPEVDRFFSRALTREPEGRFQSAAEFADAFSELAASNPTVVTSAENRSVSTTGSAVTTRVPSFRSTVGARIALTVLVAAVVVVLASPRRSPAPDAQATAPPLPEASPSAQPSAPSAPAVTAAPSADSTLAEGPSAVAPPSRPSASARAPSKRQRPSRSAPVRAKTGAP